MTRGPKPDPGSMRSQQKKGATYRPPNIPLSYERLIVAIATNRNISKSEVIQRALIALASIEEAEQAGMVE